jgi:hypothetical protein
VNTAAGKEVNRLNAIDGLTNAKRNDPRRTRRGTKEMLRAGSARNPTHEPLDVLGKKRNTNLHELTRIFTNGKNRTVTD